MAFEENPAAGKTAPGSAGVVTFSREPEASGGFSTQRTQRTQRKTQTGERRGTEDDEQLRD